MCDKQKITREDGSAMTLAILLMALFLIVSSMIMSQINNQIKSNSKMYNEAKNKYEAEGNIEKQISEIYKGIKTFIDDLKDPCKKDYTHHHEGEPSKMIYYKDGNENIEIKANIDVKVTKHVNTYTREIVKKEIDLSNLTDIQIESIVNNYKVTTVVDFKIDSSNNLTYNIKSYNKQPLN